jgi:hypothetical protein
MEVEVTVLVPTHDHGRLLLASVQSALTQTVRDLEILIVGDGVTEPTRAAVHHLLQIDSRVRFVDYPKAPQWGEQNRHRGVLEARGSIVCYLPDDDLWLPTHVETMQRLLADADFAHALPLPVRPDGTIGVWTLDLSLEFFRRLVLLGATRIGMGGTAHWVDAYHRLPLGWQAPPDGINPVLHLWQQVLAHPGLRAVSGSQPTVLRFLTPERATWTLEQRAAELDRWSESLSTPAGRDELRAQVIDVLVRDRARLEAQQQTTLPWRVRQCLLGAWRDRIGWETRERIKRLPVAGRFLTGCGERLFGRLAR